MPSLLIEWLVKENREVFPTDYIQPSWAGVSSFLFFIAKDHIVNILGFEGHMVSSTTIQLYCCGMKEAIHNCEMNGCDCVPIQLYLEKQMVSCNLPTYALESCFSNYLLWKPIFPLIIYGQMFLKNKNELLEKQNKNI